MTPADMDGQNAEKTWHDILPEENFDFEEQEQEETTDVTAQEIADIDASNYDMPVTVPEPAYNTFDVDVDDAPTATADINDDRGRPSVWEGDNVGSAEVSAPKKEWKQPIEVEYNLPTRFNPNKRRFRPNTEKAKARQKKKAKLNLVQSIIDYFRKKED
ncbi:hypothetical protein BDB01DRAFT_840173 [Pilobolus umbonatus]|nr:hypothetical protein BDB01DRAFT_840351 [Pilobolus umbonatus]KAI8969554.1 hypothetical protein BDB01DRAFT_840173 [Pilobolus umbonatus]